MTRSIRAGSGAIGLVVTDLFISATAALLMVLALAAPTRPVDPPIAGDLVAQCVQDAGGAPALRVRDRQITSADDLASMPQALGLTPRLFYTIALVSTAEAPVSTACLDWAMRDLVRAHNARTADPGYSGPIAIFAIAPTIGPVTP